MRRYGMNTYIAGCGIEFATGGAYRATMVYGRKLYDKANAFAPMFIPPDEVGLPHQMVLYIAGDALYPTSKGYVRVPQSS